MTGEDKEVYRSLGERLAKDSTMSKEVSTTKSSVPRVIRHTADYSLVVNDGVPMIHNVRLNKYTRLTRAAYLRFKRIASDREFRIRADERYTLAQEAVSLLKRV